MIDAAILSVHSSLSSVPPTPPASPGQDHPAAAWIRRQLSTASPLSLPLCCENDRNVFNHIQPLFFAFSIPNPFLSTPSSLFFAKQGARGITVLLKSLRVCNSRYLQCSQQNTNSLRFFSTSTLCFHHFMNSLAQKHPG